MQQNIDHRFKEAIGQLDSHPADVQRDPEASWASIQAMLDHDRRKRRGAWRWIAAAASVAMLITLGWLLLPSASQESQDLAANGQAQEPTLSDTAEDLPGKRETHAFSEIASAIEPEPSAKQREKAGTTVQTREQKAQQGTLADKSGQQLIASGGTYTYHWTPVANGTVSNATPHASSTASYAVTPNYQPPQFKWNFGEGKEGNKTNPVAGTYTVTTMDANGCVAGKKTTLQEQQKAIAWGYLSSADTVRMDAMDPYGYESYAETVENSYYLATQEPLSTFSIDVDRASYTNHRRFIEAGSLPPKYAVRAEEFINYFDYDYAQPRGNVPFSILPEVTTCPWNPKHKLVRIALKGREVSTSQVPPSNIVFLLDVSGSMQDADKLPLLKQALTMLTEKLREQDKVSIVVYAGAAGMVLPPTSGSNKRAILAALDQLSAGGSTAGGAGIELAYATAKQHFIKEGNNRVILATDGDFNVGTSDEAGLERLIVKKREEGVFLSVLGFGQGNLQDSKMELLADKGNGNYNYIDSDREAQKVLVSEFGGTLYTIAKDVKIQVEFNPAKVESYRLVGYENRKLRNEDFANDRIDAGELGAGHTVTAFYEIIPAEGESTSNSQDLKYQQRVLSTAAAGKELLTVKLRYKDPDGSVSKLLEQVLLDDGRNIAQTSDDFRWAVAVAEYALILRESEYKGLASFEQVLALARSAVGADREGYRREFIGLVTRAAGMVQTAKGN